jgi:hypothetical protein
MYNVPRPRLDGSLDFTDANHFQIEKKIIPIKKLHLVGHSSLPSERNFIVI